MSETEVREHVLKVAPAYMDALLDGSKTFEVRRNDRGFQRGDTLLLWEWEYRKGRDEPWSIDRQVRAKVTFVFSGDPSLRDCGGVHPGYVVLGLAPAPAGDSGGERCANYKPPMTCLTAPSSEAGRCDFCRVEAADFARSPR